MDTTTNNALTVTTQLNIITVLWKGNFRYRDYTDDDVWNLYNSISKWCVRHFNMYCLTNDISADVPAKKIQLLHDWSGWWAKMELFRPDLPDKFLYIDLDSFLVSNIEPLIDECKDGFVMAKGAKTAPINTQDGIWNRAYRSGIMYVGLEKPIRAYDAFCKAPQYYMRHYRGDQDVLADLLPKVKTFSKQLMVKLENVLKRNVIPTGAVVITGGNKIEKTFRKIPNWLNQRGY